MKKVLAGLKNGDWKTRLYIIGTPLLILAGIAAIVVSFQIDSMWLFLLGIAAGIGAVIIAQRFTIVMEERERQEGNESSSIPMQTADREEEAEDEKPESGTEAADREKSLDAYDEKKLKQVFYKYKVKRNHECIMIDSWEQYNVYQCPAYIWISRRQLHILIMGEETREIEVPEASMKVLRYHPGVVCRTKEEYPQFRSKTMLAGVFSKYLPSYHSGNRNGRPVIYKNLFELGNGLFLTNTSARVVLDMLQPIFQVEDFITEDVHCQEIVKDIYKLGILLRNLVYTAKEYKSLLNEKMQFLSDTSMSEEEYEEILQTLLNMKLITNEYKEYYKNYRLTR